MARISGDTTTCHFVGRLTIMNLPFRQRSLEDARHRRKLCSRLDLIFQG